MEDEIDRDIVICAQAVSFGSTVIGTHPLIEGAARVLITEYIPLELEYASNGKASHHCYCPPRALAAPQHRRQAR